MKAPRLRLAYVTAGAAGMYCGSCMRDNTLATALHQLGHDCVLVPTYTPIRTDETDVSTRRVFLGGISVYLEEQYPWLRRMPGWLSRALSQRWLLRLASRMAVNTQAEDLVGLTLSMLRGPRGHQARELERLADWLRSHVQPDVVLLTNVLLSGLVPVLRERLGCPIVPLLQGDDIFLDALPDAARQQAIALIQANCADLPLFLASSQYYADFMPGYLGLPASALRVVYPGINLNGFPERQREDQSPTLRIGYLARIAPEKGLHVLVEALGHLAKQPDLPPWEFAAAGYLAPNRQGYLDEQRQRAMKAGWGGRFRYAGEPDHAGKIAFLSSLDLFSVPATYHEPKGIYLLEALACGVPVVQPRHGAFPEIVDATQGGILVEPDRPEALAEGLRPLMLDVERRKRCGESGQIAVRTRFTAQSMAEATLDALGAVLPGRWPLMGSPA